MLEANEINPNVSEDKLTMEADDDGDDSKVNKSSEGEKILKGLTMEVSWWFTKNLIVSAIEVSLNSRLHELAQSDKFCWTT